VVESGLVVEKRNRSQRALMEGDAPISKAPSSDDPAPPAPITKDDEIDKGGWWSSWTPLAKTLTGKNRNEKQTVKIQM
jgi:hypothetical protein